MEWSLPSSQPLVEIAGSWAHRISAGGITNSAVYKVCSSCIAHHWIGGIVISKALESLPQKFKAESTANGQYTKLERAWSAAVSYSWEDLVAWTGRRDTVGNNLDVVDRWGDNHSDKEPHNDLPSRDGGGWVCKVQWGMDRQEMRSRYLHQCFSRKEIQTSQWQWGWRRRQNQGLRTAWTQKEAPHRHWYCKGLGLWGPEL